MRKVFFVFRTASKPDLTVVFDLFDEAVPRTAQRFAGLCTGQNDSRVSYKLAPVTRVIAPEFIVQAGRIDRGARSPDKRLLDVGEYGAARKSYVGSGLLCVASTPADSELGPWSAEFFVTLQSLEQYKEMDGFMVIGRLSGDLDRFRDWMASVDVDDATDEPLQSVWIARCGELVANEEPKKKRRKHGKNRLRFAGEK